MEKDIILFEFEGELTEKEQFIGDYLNKHMKGHGFDYNFEYINKLEEETVKAEKAWKRKEALTNQ